MTVAAMALAGGAGALLRLVLTTRWGAYATFGINVVGSLLLGLLVGAKAGSTALLIAGTGFCGGFTTFSTYALEVVGLSHHRRRAAAGYAAATLLAAGLAAALGLWIGARLR